MEEDAYTGYLDRARERVDVFDAAESWTAQVVDEVIHPKETRKRIIEALELTRNKRDELPPGRRCAERDRRDEPLVRCQVSGFPAGRDQGLICKGFVG